MNSKSDNQHTPVLLNSNWNSLFFSSFVSFSSTLSPILLFPPSSFTFPQNKPTYNRYNLLETGKKLACRLITHTTPVTRGHSVSARDVQKAVQFGRRGSNHTIKPFTAMSHLHVVLKWETKNRKSGWSTCILRSQLSASCISEVTRSWVPSDVQMEARNL